MATNEEVLAESTRVAQEAARVAGLGEFKQGVGVTPQSGAGSFVNPNALPVPTSGGPQVTSSIDAFLKQAQDKLFGQVDIISSQNQNLEASIKDIISNVEKGREASAQRIESQFGREIDFTKEQLGQQRTSVLESRKGFATNQAILTQIDERTDKQIKDLEQRKQELLLAGEAEAAGQIANLQLQALQFQQQAQQQAFSNILGIANFGLGVQQEARLTNQFEAQERRLQQAQDLARKQAIADIRLQFPEANITSDMTYEEAVQAAQPIAAKDKARRQRLEEIKANENSATENLLNQQIDSAVLTYSELYKELILTEGLSPQQAWQGVLLQAQQDGIDVPVEAASAFQSMVVTQEGNDLTQGIPREEPTTFKRQSAGELGQSTGQFLSQSVGQPIAESFRIQQEYNPTIEGFRLFGSFVSGLFR